MIGKGLIKNIHEPIQSYFPEILESNDPKKKEITIFHLLTMTSGLQIGNFQGSKNWVKFKLEQSIIYNSGSTFQYNAGDSHLLSEIIQKVSGITTASFAEKNLFHTLGINKYTWLKDPQGIHGGRFCVNGMFGQCIFIVSKLNILAVVKRHLQNDKQTAQMLFFEELLGSWKDDGDS